MAKRMKAVEAWAVVHDDYLAWGAATAWIFPADAMAKRGGVLGPGERLARVRIVEIAPRKRKVKL